jgi:GntR family transcriptional regulator / MocR family aminotransferase
MFPYKSIIQLDKQNDTPVYVQIANSFGREIRNGVLKSGTILPGARTLADLLEINRNTVAAVYNELHLQGYIELHPRKGAFISSRIPEINPKPIEKKTRNITIPDTSGYEIERNNLLTIPDIQAKRLYEFNDGLPDERIAPLAELSRSYRSVIQRGSRVQFSYTDARGNENLRKAISNFVNETRGLQTTAENVLITKGSQMGIYLVSQLLLKSGDVVVVGNTNYFAADLTFQYSGARLLRVPVDAMGIDVDAIEKICTRKKIRAVYVTPHHHFPTTVTLSACRRMKLLELAEENKFAIIEDDYDYDFHYASAPILPLASADHKGMVINIGSFSKNFSPALRLAYLVAPANIIHELAKLRFIIDRQGDYLLEQALAELFAEGVVRRHLKKSLTVYRARRDVLAELLKTKLKDAVRFEIPAGGLAIWTIFDKKISLRTVADRAIKKGLFISDERIYNTEKSKHNATRLGFASMNEKELAKCIDILKSVI